MRETVSNPTDNDAAFARLQKVAGSGLPGAKAAQEAVKRATTKGLIAALGRKPS